MNPVYRLSNIWTLRPLKLDVSQCFLASSKCIWIVPSFCGTHLPLATWSVDWNPALSGNCCCRSVFASAMCTSWRQFPFSIILTSSALSRTLAIVRPPCFLAEGLFCVNSLSLPLAGVDFFCCFLAGETQEHALVIVSSAHWCSITKCFLLLEVKVCVPFLKSLCLLVLTTELLPWLQLCKREWVMILVLETTCTRQPERQLLWSSYTTTILLIVTTTHEGTTCMLALKVP